MLGEKIIREAFGLPLPLSASGAPIISKANVMSETVTEFELAAAAHVAGGERVTNEQVERFIVEEHFFTAADGVAGGVEVKTWHPSMELLTFCVLVLANGFTVHGVSACADPKNFNPQIGNRIARENAKEKIWELLGFELRSKLALAERLPI